MILQRHLANVSPQLLSDTWFVKIFFHHLGCSFYFLDDAVCSTHFFKFWHSPIYLFFPWIACAFDVIIKKSLSNPIKSYLPSSFKNSQSPPTLPGTIRQSQSQQYVYEGFLYWLQHVKAEVLHTYFLTRWALQQILALFHINICQQIHNTGSHFITPFSS